MRMVLAISLLVLAACRVEDRGNETTISFNEELAENTAEDVANAAENAGEAIANGAEDLANRAENVDVDVDTNTADNRN